LTGWSPDLREVKRTEKGTKKHSSPKDYPGTKQPDPAYAVTGEGPCAPAMPMFKRCRAAGKVHGDLLKKQMGTQCCATAEPARGCMGDVGQERARTTTCTTSIIKKRVGPGQIHIMGGPMEERSREVGEKLETLERPRI